MGADGDQFLTHGGNEILGIRHSEPPVNLLDNDYSNYMRLRAVLFDLDDTLFDHTFASFRALEMLHASEPGFADWTMAQFAARHSDVLEAMHADVVAGKMTVDAARAERFRRLLGEAGGAEVSIDEARAIARKYRAAYEASWQPVAGAAALLAGVRAEGIRIAIVTNNLVSEQRAKLRSCAFESSIDALVTSEETGSAKPDARIFQHALEQLGAAPGDAVMVGDAWSTDIEGARAAGIRPIWFNRRGLPRPDRDVAEITALEPLANALSLITRHSP